MTPTEKQKCIAEQSVYGDLKVLDRDNELWTYAGLGLSELMEGDCALYDDNDNVMYDWIDEVKPILRPMSDLTKEITHKGCNDDQPFIPLVELAKMLNPKLHWSLETDTIGAYAYARENAFPHYVRPSQLACCSIDLFDLLHQWHFDTRNLIEDGDAVDVDTLNINPYSVK